MTESKKKSENVNKTPEPRAEEVANYGIKSAPVSLAASCRFDSTLKIAAMLAEKYPSYLILVQSGTFMHAYGKSAYVLHKLRSYKPVLAGTAADMSIRVGFPLSHVRRRIWALINEFAISTLVAFGSKSSGYQYHLVERPAATLSLEPVLAVPDDLVANLLQELIGQGELRRARGMHLLLKKDDVSFRLKQVAQNLEAHMLRDIIKMPRHLRGIYGENLRALLGRIMYRIFEYSGSVRKIELLTWLSAEVDLLKYRLVQAFELNLFNREKLDYRAGLAVELGAIVGGLLKKHVNTKSA